MYDAQDGPRSEWDHLTLNHERSRVIRLLTSVALLAVLHPGALWSQAVAAGRSPSSAQEAGVLRLPERCATCRLESHQTLQIEGSEGELWNATRLVGTARDSQGRFWMVMGSSTLVHVLDRQGRLVGLVGRRGQGPGEFQSPNAVVPVGDSVVVFDVANARATMVGVDLQSARSFRLAGQVFSGASIGWPRVVINASIPNPDRAGFPFHILDLRDGVIEASFGGRSGGDFTPRNVAALFGHVLVSPSGREVWTISRTDFRVQRWTLRGEPIRTVAPDRDWFPPGGRNRLGGPSVPPDPVVLAAQSVGNELLVVFAVARSDWRRAWGNARGRDPHLAVGDLPAMEDLFQNRVALINLEKETVEGLWDHEVAPAGWAQPGDVFVEVEAALVPVIRFRRLSVTR